MAPKEGRLPFDLRHQKGSPATKAVFRLRSFFAMLGGSHVADLPNKNGDFMGFNIDLASGHEAWLAGEIIKPNGS